MSNTIIITGFDAFGSLRKNPSETLVRWLSQEYGGRIRTEILSTSYKSAADSIRNLIRSDCPAALLMFGYSANAHGLRFEQLARNLDSAHAVDNDGNRGGRVIVDGAPSSYGSTADVETMTDTVKRAGSRFELSDDAGGYVCNHAYFVALHELTAIKCGAPCVFMHLSEPTTPPEWDDLKRGAKRLIDSYVPIEGDEVPS